jgi:hypothetical protein
MEVVMKQSRITLYLDEDMKGFLENWAKAERRSVNSLILRTMEHAIEQRLRDVEMCADYLLSGIVPK